MYTIDRNSYVIFEYVLRNTDGELLEASGTDDPPEYVHGYQQLLPGLEHHMVGHKSGDRFSVKVSPEEGFGVRNDELTVTVPLSEIPEDVELYIGASFDAVNEHGHSISLHVKEIVDDEVILDANHPLAGVWLEFDITIQEVRPATEHELLTVAAPVMGLDID